ncbi:MAG: hypothetical protein J5727_04865, partial [Kiritimatiellae bacterium]|nr:hypothetical protein [Kiritimatiellia bacterium]
GASPGFVNAASIGCSDTGSCGAISISGGTIMFAENQLWHIGAGRRKFATAESVMITGGSIAAEGNRIDPVPSNGVDRVYRVTVDVGAANTKVESLAIVKDDAAFDYGTNDLFTDESGNLRLWLPDGQYEFVVDGVRWTATVSDDATTAVILGLTALRIESIAAAEDTVTLVVSVEPVEWLTAETAQLLRVGAAEGLPLPGDDAALLPQADVGTTDNGDGTATVTVPRAANVPQKFYRVEAGP